VKLFGYAALSAAAQTAKPSAMDQTDGFAFVLAEKGAPIQRDTSEVNFVSWLNYAKRVQTI
jgi:hypothetical protein